jgi:hypothetical protein
MKKITSCVFLLVCAALVSAQNSAITLDRALADFTTYIAGRLAAGSTAALLPVEAPAKAASDYLTVELLNRLAQTSLKVISRQDFDLVRQEQKLQLQGDVSDETAVSIGHISGWQSVIVGALIPLDSAASAGFNLALRTLDVKTGELRGTKTYTVGPHSLLFSLLNPPNLSQQQVAEREKLLAPFDAVRNDFGLQFWPANDKTVFYEDDRLSIRIKAAADCYFVVYHIDVHNQIQVIYPNRTDAGRNTLRAGETRTIPEQSSFKLQAPFGEERILVMAAAKPFQIPYEQYNPRTLSSQTIQATRGLVVEHEGGGEGAGTASNQFVYTILPRL